MYYHYNELKKLLVIKEENKNLFRQQTEVERAALKEGLLFHKRIKDPLTVCVNIFGLVLVDGHHRWNLLPEIIEECPEFDLNIPLVKIESSEVIPEMMRTQIGRRNLTNEDVVAYIDLLIAEEGLTPNKAYLKVSEITGKSLSSLKRLRQAELAEQDKERKKEKKENCNTPNEKPIVSDDFSSTVNETAIGCNTENEDKSENNNSDNSNDLEDDTYSPEEIDERNNRYSTTTNKWGEEVIEYTNNFVPTKEQQLQVKLSKHLPQVEELESILPSFAEHTEVKSLISTFIRKYKKYIND